MSFSISPLTADKFVEAGVNFKRAVSTGTEVKTTNENFATVCSSNKFAQLCGGGDYVQNWQLYIYR